MLEQRFIQKAPPSYSWKNKTHIHELKMNYPSEQEKSMVFLFCFFEKLMNLMCSLKSWNLKDIAFLICCQ